MALFKIFNNIDSSSDLPATHHKGYMYFDVTKKLFYIDIADDNENVDIKRAPLNAWVSTYAEKDGQGNTIDNTYLKISDAGDIISGEAEKVKHKLTFGAGGAYVFDGSVDVTVPVYTGGVA